MAATRLIFPAALSKYTQLSHVGLYALSLFCLVSVPNVPSNISVVAIPESEAIEVQWGPPTQPKGLITNYHLTILDTGQQQHA